MNASLTTQLPDPPKLAPSDETEPDYGGALKPEFASKIIIVDDVAVNVKVVRAHLEAAGYREFVGVTDATEALSIIRRENPDILLLDIMMPDVSGLDILRELRADEQFDS